MIYLDIVVLIKKKLNCGIDYNNQINNITTNSVYVFYIYTIYFYDQIFIYYSCLVNFFGGELTLQLTKENILNIDKSKFKELTAEEQQFVIQILQEFRDNEGYSQTLDDMWKADYEEIPVDIVTFICDDRFLGKSTRQGTTIYPFWMDKYKEIFDTNKEYLEVVLTGAIGTGKTVTVVVCLCYLLYLIMCLKNPQEFFKFNEGTEITIAFCNITLDLAEGVAFETMHEYLRASPWFMERGFVTGKKKLRYNPPHNITLSFGSNAGHFLGKQIYAALLDEVDFTRSALKGVDVLTAQNGIMNTYTAIKERINSRFIIDGKQYGRMFLVSSKKSEHDFLESYVRKMLASPEEAQKMLVVDEPQWVVKPSDRYSGKKFKIAVGNKLLTSHIISDDNTEEDIKTLVNQGYQILEVPVEMKQSFVLNIDTALMNLAGISVVGTTSYFNYALFKRCYLTNVTKPFPLEVLEIGLHDDQQIINYFNPDVIPDDLKVKPQFLHLDTSLKGDITGISDTAITGKKRTKIYAGAEEIETTEKCYRHLFTIGIKAPKGDEISLEKSRQFIYALKRLGFNIKRVSLDGFQSADTRQILESNGIEAIIQSMDKLKDGEQPGYSTARSAMNDGRVGMIQYEKLEDELVRLQKDNQTGKIDHPIDGSKDLADSFAGSIYNASTYEDEDTFDLELMDVVDNINDDLDDIIKEKEIFAKQLMVNQRKKSETKDVNSLPQLESLFSNTNLNKQNNINTTDNSGTYNSDDFIIW